jgi:hypothetical protein
MRYQSVDSYTSSHDTRKAIKAQPSVERYAWQGAFVWMPEDKSSGQPTPQGPIMMNEDGTLNPLGEHYRTV